MARRPRRGRGRREEPEEEIPVAAPLDESRGRPQHGPIRAPSGPDFALRVALGAAFLAGFLGAVTVLVINRVSGEDPTAILDAGGVSAVRMLAQFDTDRWHPDFGTQRAIRKRVDEAIKEKLAAVEAAGDSRDVEIIKPAIDEWLKGSAESGADWRPGFDMFVPPKDPSDDLIDAARRQGFKQVVEASPLPELVGIAVQSKDHGTIVKWGEIYTADRVYQKHGQTEVRAAKGFRIYRHPLVNRMNAPDGWATVVLSTESAQQSDVMTTAAAVGGAAAAGAFILAFLLCLGPVKMIQRLAGETESLARGEMNTRVTTRGGGAIQATAKSVQRLANLAAQDVGEPQVIAQPVPVVPVDEIHEALSPSKDFARPDGLEIETTTKGCPDAGNDYHDVISLPNGSVGLVVADIPVRGVRGAMHMAQIRALFRSEAPRSDSPAEVLKAVNRAFAADLPRGVYVTAMYAVLDPASGICRVSAAQHLPLVFWKLSKKSSARLTTQGIALGHDQGPVFDKTIEEKAIQLERGDRVVLFTDGAITAKNAAGATYGEQRFYYVVNREAPKNSAAFVNFVANDVDLFHEGSPQMDDFTILTARKLK